MTTKPPSFKPVLDQPAPTSPPDAPFFGMGGSYSQDPATGATALIERAGHPQAAQANPETPQSTPAQE